MGDTQVFPNYVDLNPNLEVMNMYQKQDEHLSNKIREKTNAIALNSQNIRSLTQFMNKLRDEYGIGMLTDGKKITNIDFSDSPEIKDLIDKLSELGLIDSKYQNKYTFHSANEIEMFMAHLEGKIEEIKNDNEPNLLLIQPLLDLMKQLADIVRKINESDERLKEMTHKL